MTPPPESDTRNLIDQYKGLSTQAIIEQLDQSRVPLEIAIENLAHDFNIGTIIRNANAFNVAKVHIVGKRRYNRRGTMVTDKYLHITHWTTPQEFAIDAKRRQRQIIAFENNLLNSQPLKTAQFSPNSILVFGSESDGISQALLGYANHVFYIEQLGSTRSINVGCASAIALYEFCRQLKLI